MELHVCSRAWPKKKEVFKDLNLSMYESKELARPKCDTQDTDRSIQKPRVPIYKSKKLVKMTTTTTDREKVQSPPNPHADACFPTIITSVARLTLSLSE